MNDKENTKVYKNKKSNKKEEKLNKKKEKVNKKKNKENKEINKNKGNKTKVKKIILRVLLVLLFVILIAAGILVGKVYSMMKEAKMDMADVAIKHENSVVVDINGNVIATLSGDEVRDSIKLSDMSPYLPTAFVSIEDERFFKHHGVDIQRTATATIKWGLSKIGIGDASYGGSTITQQLVKNLTDEKDRTWERKVTEMARAYYIEEELSKLQILELYLNLIFVGKRNFGVEIASNYYFNKSASDLSLAESAFLAGINNSPNAYDPFDYETDEELAEKMDLINRRTKTVLAKMLELGEISPEIKAINQEEYDAAIAEVDEGLKFEQGNVTSNVYSYHTDAAVTQVINELMEKNGWSNEYAKIYVTSGGLTIYSTQDTSIQEIMEAEFAKPRHIKNSSTEKDENGNPVTSQAAMVIIDHAHGYVVGTVGGLGEKTTSFGLNRATQSTRQTGSSMKPLAVLVPGIETGVITAGTVLDDVPTTFANGTYKVNNYGDYKGLVTVRYAIGTSQNIPMVKAIQKIGVSNSIEYLKKLGISTIDDEKDNYLGLALGGLTNGISPLEMAAAYATIANDGVYIEPTFYTKVVDSNGNTVLEAEQETRTVISKSAAYVIKEILTQPAKAGGTASNCAISGISVAAKTGSTDEYFDRWLCGFTPYYAAATWYGYDKNEVIVSGNNPASVLWSAVMSEVHRGMPSKYFSSSRPDGVVTATICKSSGLLATEDCKNDPRGDQSYTEYFVRGTAPKQTCNCHVKVKICNETGLLATEFCQDVTEQVFITRPDVDTNTSWQKALDAKYTLTIKDTCTKHTKPVEPENNEVEGNNTTEGNNTVGGNTTGQGNETGNNTSGGNNVVENNSTEGNNTSGGNNTVGNNTTGGNTTEGGENKPGTETGGTNPATP